MARFLRGARTLPRINEPRFSLRFFFFRIMKLDKTTLLSSLGLSVIHFLFVLVGTQFRPDFLKSGNAGAITDKIEAVLTQPGIWVADFMGCISEKPMWWILLVLNSVLWGNVLAYIVRTLFKGGASK